MRKKGTRKNSASSESRSRAIRMCTHGKILSSFDRPAVCKPKNFTDGQIFIYRPRFYRSHTTEKSILFVCSIRNKRTRHSDKITLSGGNRRTALLFNRINTRINRRWRKYRAPMRERALHIFAKIQFFRMQFLRSRLRLPLLFPSLVSREW